MSRIRSTVASLAVVSALAACGAPERGATAGTTAAEPSGTSTTATSTATPTPTALVRTAFALEPTTSTSTASRLALSAGAEVVVDPRATFEVELAALAPDARLVLLDAREDFVSATSSRELGASTRLTLAPAAPLVPGSRYALRLDGTTERVLHDAAGRAFAPLSLPLLAAGTPPPPEPKKATRKKRHR
ncbi:MAG TPA: hypothetical protein VF875_09680 [Anaeromyxobacter sp.]